ncbi:MAG: septum site-determining protein MinC [Bacillota bacterium]
MNEGIVVFKGTRGGIEVLFDALAPFEALKEELGKKLTGNARFFGKRADVKVSAVVGRDLLANEKEELLNIFSRYFNAEGIEFVSAQERERMAAQASSRRVQAVNDAYASALYQEEDKCLFVRSTLRNGQKVHSEGNIVVMGDVNPGAQLVAGGNIVVLGTLRGVAHAGAWGNTDAVVFALNLQPTQLRIADIIAIAPKEEQKTGYPELAQAHQGEIVIVPYDPGSQGRQKFGSLRKV